MQHKESRKKTAPPPGGESHSSFIERALAARDEARRTGEYFNADEVLRELDELSARAPASSGELANRTTPERR